MNIITADQINQLLEYPALIEALRAAFCGDYVVPTRHHHEISETATHLLMPAWSAGAPKAGAYLGTKLVNIFGGNAALGLPAVSGTYVLQSGETGQPLCVMDGTRLTVWRTAAVSALASSVLAREDASNLLMVGAGALAPCLIAAHASVRKLSSVTLWNRRRSNSERLADSLRDAPFIVEIADDLGTAVAAADIVSTATLSQAPIILGHWLKPGVHVDLVGAFNLHMREADDETLLRSRLFVDTQAAKIEGGDVAVAIKSGAISPDLVLADLAALVRGAVQGRTAADDITVFKSVGTAISDLAAAILVWQRVQNS